MGLFKFKKDEPKINSSTLVLLTESGKLAAESGQGGVKTRVILGRLQQRSLMSLDELVDEIEDGEVDFPEVKRIVTKLAKSGFVRVLNEVKL